MLIIDHIRTEPNITELTCNFSGFIGDSSEKSAFCNFCEKERIWALQVFE